MTVTLLGMSDHVSVADGNVEQRIADFWKRVDALGPGDYISAADLGQWALNVIERNPRARITVADFRNSTAGMQGGMDRAGLGPGAATPPPAPTPTPGPAVFTFGGGTKIIPTEVPPGTYRTRSAASGCYWERLSGFGGTFGEIIANGIAGGPEIVTIRSTDKGFSSTRCAVWSADLSAITPTLTAPFGTGTFQVGIDISAGTWRSTGGTSCYWERMSGYGGGFTDIIANGSAGDTTIVTISASDKGFSSARCGTWTKIG